MRLGKCIPYHQDDILCFWLSNMNRENSIDPSISTGLPCPQFTSQWKGFQMASTFWWDSYSKGSSILDHFYPDTIISKALRSNSSLSYKIFPKKQPVLAHWSLICVSAEGIKQVPNGLKPSCMRLDVGKQIHPLLPLESPPHHDDNISLPIP